MILSAGALATTITSSLSLKASQNFGIGNLFCRILKDVEKCIKAITCATTVTSGKPQPSTMCTVVGGTLCTKSTCSAGSTWRTATHTSFFGKLKKVLQ